MSKFLLIGFALFIIVILLSDDTSNQSQVKGQRTKLKDFGKKLYYWESTNSIKPMTKVFMFLMSIIPLFILLFEIKVNSSSTTNIIKYINSITISLKSISDIEPIMIMLVGIYLAIILSLINIPVSYFIFEKGITKKVNLFFYQRKETWDKLVCFDILETKEVNYIKLWFSPPEYKCDWIFPMEKRKTKELETFLLSKAVRYKDKLTNK